MRRSRGIPAAVSAARTPKSQLTSGTTIHLEAAVTPAGAAISLPAETATLVKEGKRRPPTDIAGLFARGLAATTEYHGHEGQEHLIHRRSRDRAQCRRRVGPL